MISLSPDLSLLNMTVANVGATQQTTVTEVVADEKPATEDHTTGLISDLAWILLLAAIVTLIFKKLKQPVVLGYILAGFLASPGFTYLPSISSMTNIHFWADLGIVVLMFTLGLEFSFKKLLNSGSSAIMTSLIIILGMTFAGFGVGKLLHLDHINCIFLGGMISMSSTTIILKALTDLGMRQQKFASLVLATLIIEDLFAVLMLVVLSSLAVGNVNGGDLIFSIGKLSFFIIIWFVVGVYVLPTLLYRTRRYLNDESLLVVSMALCFSMAVFSVACGFSLELGAFVMGSILAGTMAAERMEHVIQPVKDLFGSIFFISVGMMVDPTVITQYWGEILLLAAVVIIGMIFFGAIGMLATGQSLRVAIESGFTLTQIGEFSFIIASLGMSLGVLQESLYPIIVAVSVITIFTTPYFIKMAIPAYTIIERHLPSGLRFLLDRYSEQTSDSNETRALWKALLKRYLWRIVLYSVILIAIILLSRRFLFPLLTTYAWGRHAAVLITLAAMSPFLVALSFSSLKPGERARLHRSASFYDVPLVAMRIFRYLLALLFIVYFTSLVYGSHVGWIIGIISFLLIIFIASTRINEHYKTIERKFMSNLNIREDTRSGRNNNLVSDIHQAFIKVDHSSPFVGDRLRDTGIRSQYGISISSIQRGQKHIPLPTLNARIFPGDILGIIGTDEQIMRFNEDIEKQRREYENRPVANHRTELASLKLTENSPIVGKPLAEVRLRQNYFSMIVTVQIGDNEYVHPDPTTVLHPGDTIWIVGDPEKFSELK